MRKVLCVLTLLGIVTAASADISIRIWLSSQAPPGVWRPTYGPFTPYATGSNDAGAYDVHRNYVSSTNPGDVATPKFLPDNMALTPEAPVFAAPGDNTPLYIWAAFDGHYADADPLLLPNGLGWAPAGTKVNGMNITLVASPGLAIAPVWYQIATGTTTAYRWESTSDMTGNVVTLAGVNAAGFQNSSLPLDRLQSNLDDNTTGYGAGAILLGALKATGAGTIQVGLEYNGISIASTADPIPAVFFPGVEAAGIVAGTVPQGTAPRVGHDANATFIPEPASLLLIGLGALILRRR